MPSSGAVLSYLKAVEAADELLPARSVQLPLIVKPVPSGPLYVPLEQLSIPLVASVPVVDQSTAWLYQPLWSAILLSALPNPDGAVASYFSD
jgi:hypothetical protein